MQCGIAIKIDKSVSPDIEPHIQEQLIFSKDNSADHFYHISCWSNWTFICRRMKLDYSLIPYTKINSGWIKDLNIRPETISVLE